MGFCGDSVLYMNLCIVIIILGNFPPALIAINGSNCRDDSRLTPISFQTINYSIFRYYFLFVIIIILPFSANFQIVILFHGIGILETVFS